MKRSRLLFFVAVVLVAPMLFSACQPQVVTQVVTKEVKVTEQVTIEKLVTPTPIDYGDVVWLSTQFNAINEAEAIRGVVLKGFPAKVEFVPDDAGAFFDRINAEVKAGKGTVSVLSCLAGEFSNLQATNSLKDLTSLKAELKDAGIPDAFWKVASLGTDKTWYIPMMQATYILAINKKALPYLPKGADVNALTYDQLLEWGKNIKEGTGEAKLGFPAGDSGLLHRFFEGFLVPAFSGGVVTTFKSSEAAQGWQWMKDVWPYVNPQSTTYNFMQEPLLSEEVWIAWDHTARLKDAFSTRPDDFLAVPVPAGPKGRAFMPVLAGLGIPTTSTNEVGAEALIKFMETGDAQINILRETGFFPVINIDYPGYVSTGIMMEGDAVTAQSSAKDALTALLPQGLGDQGDFFNKPYRDTFIAIVLNGKDITTTLEEQAKNVQAVMDKTKAPCWAPDPDSAGQPCKVK
jgi:multiple sugar transport system substrate-binding protein